MAKKKALNQDPIRLLGPLAFASRLKRLSERLMKDVSRLYRELDFEMVPRWFPVLYLLGEKSPQAITELSGNLKLTHPAVNQVAGQLEKAGYIRSKKDSRDERRRLIYLNASGRDLISRLRPVWDDIEKATAEVIDCAKPNILDSLTIIEEELDKDGIYKRVRRRLRSRYEKEIEIINYRPSYKKYFKEINEAWLNKYFKIEPIDRKILNDPQSQVIVKGGRIFFARHRKTIVGTVAFIPMGNDDYELAKMGVVESYQELGIGRLLVQAVIAEARSRGAKRIILFTSPKLKEANNLYRSLGFKKDSSASEKRFTRQTFSMKLKL